MAKENERPQFNPKHRIAGAIILVSLAVIFVPMFLDDSAPAKETRNLTEIPSRDTPVADTKVVVTQVPAPEADKPRVAAAEPVAEQTVAEAAPVAKAEPAKAEPEKAQAPKAERRTTNVAAVDNKKTDANANANANAKARPVAAKSNDTAEKVSKGWIVQVGTFSNTDNADRLREKLKSHGFAVSAEDVTVNGGKAVRLRVGPFRDKSSASNAQAQLQKELNLHGMVLAYP